MFKPIPAKPDFPKMEEDILRVWKDNNIFFKTIESRSQSPKFIMYEGPPTANGKPGIHHALSRIFKDVVPRYRTMKGFCVPRKAGWDTHGLPVELEIEKKLGFTNKTQIENYGIDKFNDLCRKSVFAYLEDWNALTERLGFWLDLEHPYVTLDNSYIESGWWAIKQLWDKGLVYQGYRVTPHCPRCGTSLSSHEVALGYRDDTVDPSIFIKFEIEKKSLIDVSAPARNIINIPDNKPAYLLAWTTTPWTLPGNTALAVSPDANYSVFENEKDVVIMAKPLAAHVIGLDYKEIKVIFGGDLVNLRYNPLYNPHTYGIERLSFTRTSAGDQRQPLVTAGERDDLTYPVIGTDFVSMEDGTGIVHVAPAFGEVDFETGGTMGLDFVQHVDLEGKIKGSYLFSGQFVKEADKAVIDDLCQRGLMYRSDKITHTYPFCWRCDSPLLYYAKRSWYIKTTALKERLISGNEEINWKPEHIKHGRFGDWLENNVDWAFSRERYWGTPLNVWFCENCGRYECVGSIVELKSKPGISGMQEPLDLHRPYVDKITFQCQECGSGMKRRPEVVDCWFDSGAMPYAQWHYPFENQDIFNDSFPADYICEAVDQTRGWFYSLHALSILLFNQPCFRNVICLGLILDAKGEKMSKTRGNVIDPMQVINKYGADALRWYFFTSSPPGNVRRFSEDNLKDVTRNFISTLWNIYSFFVMYARIDNYKPESQSATSNELDRWIISELNDLIRQVTADLDSYEPTMAARRIADFVDVLSNWYIRRSRRRFWKSVSDTDKNAAYDTLYHCLVTLTALMAPFAPFITETIYHNLVLGVVSDASPSVHMVDFPVYKADLIDEKLMSDTRLVMKLSSLGRAARSKAQVKVRQPLSVMYVKVNSSGEREAVKKLSAQLEDEVNVKKVELVTDVSDKDGPDKCAVSEGEYCAIVATKLTPELVNEGITRDIVRRLQTMRKNGGFEIQDNIITYYSGECEIEKAIESFAEYIKQETLSLNLVNGIPEPGICQESYNLDGLKVVLGITKA